MELKVNQGAGRARLTLGGLALSRLDVEIGAGETDVDLSGDWKNDLTANIQGGVGRATVRLPTDVGVRARAQGGIGAIHVHGLKKDGDAYVNEAYGKSPVTVNVEVQGGVGEINLELGETPPSV
jgi:predicted membrane protein